MKNFDQTKYELLYKYINDCKKNKIISQDDIIKIYKEIEKNPELSKEKLKKVAIGNLRIVIKIAKKYYDYKKPSYLSLLDLIGEGNKGLMVATQKYKLSFGVKFNSYAVWWMRQKINRALTHYESIVNIPYYKLDVNCSSVSLDSGDLSRYIEAEYLECKINEKIKKICIKNDVKNILKILNEKEKTIIKKRYGIPLKNENYYIPFTQKEIGKEIGKTAARVEQIEKIIIKKIRKYIEKNKLEAAYDI